MVAAFILFLLNYYINNIKYTACSFRTISIFIIEHHLSHIIDEL